MQNIMEIYNAYSIYIVAALILLVIILFIIIIIYGKSIDRVEVRLKKLTRGIDNTNLEELISSYMDRVEKTTEESDEIKKLYSDIHEKVDKCLQNISVLRFKAFENVGSDLSFSIAMLDNNKDGVVITSIYGRNESTTYAKPVDKGISRYELSVEENTVLNNAIEKIG
ncbi:DUF4446 family protein [Clostridium akagii]|uniref:DUF4446 family protein n=1 Tax=Clostridium akagii TaxID=91623 RepID=UPI00047A359A|nr:DUF4446 family protein [Clostridium akagii]